MSARPENRKQLRDGIGILILVGDGKSQWEGFSNLIYQGEDCQS